MEGMKWKRVRSHSALLAIVLLASITLRFAFQTCNIGLLSSQAPSDMGAVRSLGSSFLSRAPGRDAPIPIFFYITEMKASALVFLNITATFNPHTPLYMLTSNATPPRGEIMSRLKQLRVKVRYVEHYVHPGSDIEIFRKHYVHRAVNPLWYERMCFERFFILKEVALLEGIERMAYSDADVALFMDVHETPFAKFDSGFVSITIWSTYFGLWRLETLAEFCKYMLWFYQRPEPEIDATIHQYGDWIVQPPNADPKNHSNYVWQFSDMFMLSAFLQSQNVSKTTLLEDADAMKSLVALENPSRLRPPGDESFVCESGAHFDSYLDWRMTPQGVLGPYHNGTLLAGIHFQGPCKDDVVPHVFRKLFPGSAPEHWQWRRI